MSGTHSQRSTIVPVGHPLLASRKAPLILPRDTRQAYDREIAILMARKNRRPEVVVTSQFVIVPRRPEVPRDIGRFKDNATQHRRPIYAKSVANAQRFGVTLRKRPAVAR